MNEYMLGLSPIKLAAGQTEVGRRLDHDQPGLDPAAPGLHIHLGYMIPLQTAHTWDLLHGLNQQ